jgi:lipid-binding SYLF domain-containing protein
MKLLRPLVMETSRINRIDRRLGGQIAVSIGATGRSAEASQSIIDFAPVYSYSKSKGIFAGISVEGTVIMPRKEINTLKYGSATSADILGGRVERPVEAEAFYRTLDLKFADLGKG